MEKNIIIVGCGRVGSQLAKMLSNSGKNVSVIDRKVETFANLGSDFNGNTFQGVGFDEDVLIRAGIEECAVVAAVTQSDTTNMMVAEVASRIYQVPHVISRLYNPDHERTYMQLGFDYTCGTSLVAEDIFSKIMSGHGSHLDTFGEYEVLKFSLNLSSIGRTNVRAADLEREHDIRICAFERADGSASSIPARDSVLYQGDSIIACIRHDCLTQFSRFIQD